MCCIVSPKVRTCSELSDEFLDSVVVDLFVYMDQPIAADVQEDIIIRLELPAQELVLQEVDPSVEMRKHVNVG
jgi:hypothetical protein